MPTPGQRRAASKAAASSNGDSDKASNQPSWNTSPLTAMHFLKQLEANDLLFDEVDDLASLCG